MPSRLNWPSSRLSAAIWRSPWKTRTVTAVWLSSAVLNVCFAFGGNRRVLRSTSFVKTPPKVSIPKRQRSDIQQQHVLAIAGQHASLDSGAYGYDFIRIHTLVWRLSQTLLRTKRLNSRDPASTHRQARLRRCHWALVLHHPSLGSPACDIVRITSPRVLRILRESLQPASA